MILQKTPLYKGTYWSALALVALISPASATEDEALELEPTIISALRVPQAISTVTSAVTPLDTDRLQQQGLVELQNALNEAPGVFSTSTAGQTGAVSGLFIRGFTTSESLIVLDGIRMNGASAQLGNFLSNSRTYDIGNLEVLRGPQAAIYGGEAMGGVIWMETPRGHGKPQSTLNFEAGSFDSVSSYAKHEGSTDKLSYYLSGGIIETDNDASSSRYEQRSTAMRFEAAIDENWTTGTTFRLTDSYYENGGSSDQYFDNTMATLYATGRISEVWTTRLTLGHRKKSYDSVSSFPLHNDLDTTTLSADNEIRIHDDLRILGGGFFRHDEFVQDAYQSVDLNSDRYGLYTGAEWDPFEQLTTTAAIRWDDYDSHGNELTWKLGSAYRPNSGTTVRGNIGTAFRAPTYLDLYYENGGSVKGNPNLESQTSLGWDLGVEQAIGTHHAAQVTFFRNLLDNAIDTSSTTPTNKTGTSASDGVEFAFKGENLGPDLSYRLAWTHLHKSLKDQPRNTANASLQWDATDKIMLGVGATHITSRSWGGNDIAAYTTTRVFASYQLTENLKLHGRIENALDEEYELSNFSGTIVEGAGTGAYAGLTYTW